MKKLFANLTVRFYFAVYFNIKRILIYHNSLNSMTSCLTKLSQKSRESTKSKNNEIVAKPALAKAQKKVNSRSYPVTSLRNDHSRTPPPKKDHISLEHHIM